MIHFISYSYSVEITSGKMVVAHTGHNDINYNIISGYTGWYACTGFCLLVVVFCLGWAVCSLLNDHTRCQLNAWSPDDTRAKSAHRADNTRHVMTRLAAVLRAQAIISL